VCCCRAAPRCAALRTAQFRATFGDDRVVAIWRVADWSLAAAVSEPFATQQLQSTFRRLSWAPDGQLLLVSNGFHDVRFVAPALSRNAWTAAVNFVGHEAPVVAVQFNRRMLRCVAHLCSLVLCCICGRR
jgi:protein HIRA/HIR1